MNVSQAVESRSSIRKFLSKPVPSSLIKTLLQKASRSPSGGNLQPWKIFVINNLSIDKIKDINLIKEDFWFLCLNNARFALGDNNLPDHKNCRSPDNTNFIVLEKQIRLSSMVFW